MCGLILLFASSHDITSECSEILGLNQYQDGATSFFQATWWYSWHHSWALLNYPLKNQPAEDLCNLQLHLWVPWQNQTRWFCGGYTAVGWLLLTPAPSMTIHKVANSMYHAGELRCRWSALTASTRKTSPQCQTSPSQRRREHQCAPGFLWWASSLYKWSQTPKFQEWLSRLVSLMWTAVLIMAERYTDLHMTCRAVKKELSFPTAFNYAFHNIWYIHWQTNFATNNSPLPWSWT